MFTLYHVLSVLITTPNKTKKTNKTTNQTKKVFNQLVKSFDRIGQEARKDAELLKDASKKL